MKTALIFVLSLALVSAAYMTRPDRRDFLLYLAEQQTARGSDCDGAIEQAEAIAKAVTVKNRLLWTDIEKDGKVIYTGVFSHFFARGQQAEKPAISAKSLWRVIAQ